MQPALHTTRSDKARHVLWLLTCSWPTGVDALQADHKATSGRRDDRRGSGRPDGCIYQAGTKSQRIERSRSGWLTGVSRNSDIARRLHVWAASVAPRVRRCWPRSLWRAARFGRVALGAEFGAACGFQKRDEAAKPRSPCRRSSLAAGICCLAAADDCKR